MLVRNYQQAGVVTIGDFQIVPTKYNKTLNKVFIATWQLNQLKFDQLILGVLGNYKIYKLHKPVCMVV